MAKDTRIVDKSHKPKNENLSGLEALPAEIIGHILAFLPPLPLVELSRTSKHLRSHAYNDLLWFNLIRQNVPSVCHLHSSSPAQSWRELYIAHHPYWFLPRYKVWFSDVPNTGKIIIARYHPGRGCIEAYQLIAEHGAHTFENWAYDSDVIIHTFNPRVQLWTDDPVINLDIEEPREGNRLQKEIPMQLGSTHGICSMISLCRPIPKSLQDPSMALWPPNIVPADQRVRNESPNKFRTEEHRPKSLSHMSDQTFRIRKWLEFSNLTQPLSPIRMGEEVWTFSTLPREAYTPTKMKPYQGIWVGDYSGHGCEFLLVLQREVTRKTIMTREEQTGILPEGVSMIQVENEMSEAKDASAERDMDAALREERQLLHHRAIADSVMEDAEQGDKPESSGNNPSSTDLDPARYQKDHADPSPADQLEHQDHTARVEERYGRLEAIKLTGDINVPRGQHTWIAEDIGTEGFIRLGDEQMFKGARIVKSWGRIAGRGFKHDRFIPSQMIMISHDTLAQYWKVSRICN